MLLLFHASMSDRIPKEWTTVEYNLQVTQAACLQPQVPGLLSTLSGSSIPITLRSWFPPLFRAHQPEKSILWCRAEDRPIPDPPG